MDTEARGLLPRLLHIAKIRHNGSQAPGNNHKPFPGVPAKVKNVGWAVNDNALLGAQARDFKQPFDSFHWFPPTLRILTPYILPQQARFCHHK